MEFITWVIAALFGAAIMYLLDPQQGKQRREALQKQISDATSGKFGESADSQVRPIEKPEVGNTPNPAEPSQEPKPKD
jgi:hypothetical protein